MNSPLTRLAISTTGGSYRFYARLPARFEPVGLASPLDRSGWPEAEERFVEHAQPLEPQEAVDSRSVPTSPAVMAAAAKSLTPLEAAPIQERSHTSWAESGRSSPLQVQTPAELEARVEVEARKVIDSPCRAAKKEKPSDREDLNPLRLDVSLPVEIETPEVAPPELTQPIVSSSPRPALLRQLEGRRPAVSRITSTLAPSEKVVSTPGEMIRGEPTENTDTRRVVRPARVLASTVETDASAAIEQETKPAPARSLLTSADPSALHALRPALQQVKSTSEPAGHVDASKPIAPTIQVTIGRVEIRGTQASSPAQHKSPAAERPRVMPLDEYLKQHARRSRT